MVQAPQKPTSAEQHGLVVSYFGSSVAVEADGGQVFQCHLRRNQVLPVVGDRVLWQLEGPETGIIKEIMPRQSLLARGDQRGQMKPIAANVNLILIVMAPPPIFSEYLVDRYLIAAELLGIKPVLVLNKVDLLKGTSRIEAETQLAVYKNISYPVLLTSMVSGEGVDKLAILLKGQTAVLVGPSGVGKSSIIAALDEGQHIRIGDVSSKGAGKHTTTATRLYHLRQGGDVIDSPGVREFNLWPVERKDLLKGFKEFTPFLNACKFRDCQHGAEPGCAVQEAVQNGKISRERFASFQTLSKETNNKNTHFSKKGKKDRE